MPLNYLETVQTWRSAQNLLDENIQHYLQSVINLGSIPSDMIEAVSFTETTGDGIWHEINDSVQAASSRIQTLQTVATKLCLIRNRSPSLAPISKLPPEILAHIFHLCVCKPRAGWGSGFLCGSCHYYLRGLIDLSRVCSQWRAVVVHKPLFWSHLTFSPDRCSVSSDLSWNLLQTSIERASGNTLCITVLSDRFTPGQEGTQLGFEILRPFSGNIKHLCIPSCNHYRSFFPWFLANIKPPAIQSIALTASDKISQGLFDFADESYPALLGPEDESCLLSVRSIYLERASFEWNNPVYLNLTSLTLDNVSMGRRTHPRVDNILSMLSASPELHTLRLRTTVFPSNDESALPTQVYLGALMNLDLRRVGARGLTQLLTRLSISSKRLSVSFDVEIPPDSLCRAAMEEFFARAKVTRLLLESASLSTDARRSVEEHGTVPALQAICSMAPYLRSLILIGNTNLNLLKTMTRQGPTNGHEPCCPTLRTLCAISWELSEEDIEKIGKAHPVLRRMRLFGCKLPARPEFDRWLENTVKWAKVMPIDPNWDDRAISGDYPDPTRE